MNSDWSADVPNKHRSSPIIPEVVRWRKRLLMRVRQRNSCECNGEATSLSLKYVQKKIGVILRRRSLLFAAVLIFVINHGVNKCYVIFACVGDKRKTCRKISGGKN